MTRFIVRPWTWFLGVVVLIMVLTAGWALSSILIISITIILQVVARRSLPIRRVVNGRK